MNVDKESWFYMALITLSSVVVGMMFNFFIDNLRLVSKELPIYFLTDGFRYTLGLVLLFAVTTFGIYFPLYKIRENLPLPKFLFRWFV